MVLLELFWSFVKIGFTSFGGMSMIPLINSEMVSHGWMNATEVSDIVAIAEMTPGPLGLNCATFAGIRTAGILGAIMANLGILVPTFTLCAAVGFFFTRFKDSNGMKKFMLGVRPACVGLIVGAIITLSQSNYLAGSSVNLPAIAIAALDLYLLIGRKWSIPKVISISAALGLLFFGVLKL